jgi:23S rRNA maturation mini-RNase III
MSASEKVIKKRVSQKRAHSEADFEAYKIVKGAFDPVIDGHLVLHSDEEEISVLLDKAIQHIGHDEK